MGNESTDNRDFIFAPEDLTDPLRWIENLSKDQLRDWLRNALWTGAALPIVIPASSRIAIELTDVFKRGSAQLRTRVRSILPTLVQEWGRDDSTDTLDALLIFCGRLRCAAAEPAISLILSERLQGRAEIVALRQRALSVLSGFGCTARMVSIFEQYLTDIEYAAICYRALYRYDRRYGAIELPAIISLFQEAQATDELDVVIRTLVSDLKSPRKFIELINTYLAQGDPDQIVDILEVLRGVGVFSADVLLRANPDQRKKLFRLLLQRASPSTFGKLLWKLRSIGIDLHCSPAANDLEFDDVLEFIEVLIVDPKTKRKSIETILPTIELRGASLDALMSGSEHIASASVANAADSTAPITTQEEWLN